MKNCSINVIYHMIYKPSNLKAKNLMGRLIDTQEIENEKIEDYFEDFRYNLEEIREYLIILN